MKIIECNKIDTNKFKLETDCEIFIVHALIDDINKRAAEMIYTISNDSWINSLNAIDKISYKARAEKTIKTLVEDIFKKITTPIITDFGQYMVSLSAQDALEITLNHRKVPISELFKERLTGNSGFDFHTESHTRIVAFGEAKYSSVKSPYKDALVQINDFIIASKDEMELSDLSRFISNAAINKALENKKAYIAAFSINAKNPNQIFLNILKSEHIKPLLEYPELYLIGVEFNDRTAS